MGKLALFIYIMAAPTLAGIGAVAVILMKDFSPMLLIAVVLAGFIAALPLAMVVSKKLA